jgi:hypothetical protein
MGRQKRLPAVAVLIYWDAVIPPIREIRLSLPNSFKTMAPISGLTVAMHDSDYKQVIRLDRIKNGIRKYSCQTASNIILQNAPPLRCFLNLDNGMFHRCDEAKIKLVLACGVISGRLFVFSKGLWVKLKSHLPTARRTLANASSPGIVCVCPLRTSSRRRRASATHRP